MHPDTNKAVMLLPTPSADVFCPMTFGRFRLRPASRTLLRNGQPVALGSRAFDLLLALLRARGRIVAKETLMKEGWPTTTVDEGNLRAQIAFIRRALGPEGRHVKTVPGRGYLFAADLDGQCDADAERHAIMHKGCACQIVLIDIQGDDRDDFLFWLKSLGLPVNVFPSNDSLRAAIGRA